MRKLILVVLLAAAGLYGQTKKLTLSESLEIGLRNSNELKISRSKVIGAEAQITSAGSQLMPQLGFSASYIRLSNIPPFEVSLPIFPKPIQISPVILDNYSLKLSLQQPIFTGLRLVSLRNAANWNYDASQSDLRMGQSDGISNGKRGTKSSLTHFGCLRYFSWRCRSR